MSSQHHSSSQKVELSSAKIGFIGAGKAAESIINGLISHGKIEASRIHVAAPSTKNLERLKGLECHVTKRNYDIFGRYDCHIVFICVPGSVFHTLYKQGGTRPQPLCTNYIPNMKHPLYVISLVTGYGLKDIQKVLLNPDHPEKYLLEMHRIAINCACAYGQGVCSIDCEPDGKKLSSILRTLLSSIAKLEYVSESQMDASCALVGAGLPFFYYFINAMTEGGFRMGLSKDMAQKFAARTLQCAAQSMLESGKHPNELRDEVCSPSGAAIYGLHVLDKADVASGVSAAIEAAHKRNSDLAKGQK